RSSRFKRLSNSCFRRWSFPIGGAACPFTLGLFNVTSSFDCIQFCGNLVGDALQLRVGLIADGDKFLYSSPSFLPSKLLGLRVGCLHHAIRRGCRVLVLGAFGSSHIRDEPCRETSTCDRACLSSYAWCARGCTKAS